MIGVAVPRAVERRLREFDPRVRLIWNRRRARFEVLEEVIGQRGRFVHCFFVQHDSGKPIYDLGSGEFIIRELRSRDAHRRWRTSDSFVWEMTEGAERERERRAAEAEEKLSEEIIRDSLSEMTDRRTHVPSKLHVEREDAIA